MKTLKTRCTEVTQKLVIVSRNQNFDLVRIVQLFLYEHDLVRLPNSIELNPWIKFDLVQLRSIEIHVQFDWV